MKTTTKSLVIFCFILSIVILLGCKNENKEKEPLEIIEKQEEKVDDKNNLKLYFDGTIDNSDTIKLQFEDIEGIDTISKKINGMPNSWQRVDFSFPESTIPYTFKLSLLEDNSNVIKFDKIVLNRQNDRIIIKDSVLLVYFKLKNLKHRFNGKTLILEKISKNESAELISKDNLNNRIENRYSN